LKVKRGAVAFRSMADARKPASIAPGSPFPFDDAPKPNSLDPETLDGLAAIARTLNEAADLGVEPPDDAARDLEFGLLYLLADRLPYSRAPKLGPI
jgi:hypothetical protein